MRTQKYIAAIAAALFCLQGCIFFADPIPTTLTEEEFTEYSDVCNMLEQMMATENDVEDAFSDNLESIKAIDCVKDAMVSDGSALVIFENGSSIEYIMDGTPAFTDDSGYIPTPEATKSSYDITEKIENASAVVFDLFSEDKNRVAQSRLTKATASILHAVYVDFANFTPSNFLAALGSEKCEFIIVSSHGSKSFMDALHPELWAMDPYVSETGNMLAFGGTEAGIEALKDKDAHLAYDDFSKKYFRMESLEELFDHTPYGRGLSTATPKTIYFESCHTLTQPFEYGKLQVIGWTGKTKFSQAYGVILADYIYNFGLGLKALVEDFGKDGQISDPSYSSSKLVVKGGLADMQPYHESGDRLDDYPYYLKDGSHWSFKTRKETDHVVYEIEKPEQGGRYSRKETDGTTISTKIFNNKYNEQRKSQGSSQNCFVEFTNYYNINDLGDYAFTEPKHEVKELSFESGISFPEKNLKYDDVHPGILRIITSDNREPRKSVNDCVYVFFSREFEANDIYVDEETSNAPLDGLVAYYPFNGNADDESGNGNDGILENDACFNPVLTTDRFGNEDSAYSFGGIDNHNWIRVPNSESLQMTEGMTLSAWISVENFVGMDGWGKKTTTDPGFAIAAKAGDGNCTFPGSYLMVGKSSKGNGINVSANNSNGNSHYSNNRIFNVSGTKSKYEAGQWIQVTLVDGNGMAYIYIDGELAGEASSTSAPYTSMNSQDLYIGIMGGKNSSYRGCPFWYPFYGKIDDVRLYNRPLSDVEVKSLYLSETR